MSFDILKYRNIKKFNLLKYRNIESFDILKYRNIEFRYPIYRIESFLPSTPWQPPIFFLLPTQTLKNSNIEIVHPSGQHWSAT